MNLLKNSRLIVISLAVLILTSVPTNFSCAQDAEVKNVQTFLVDNGYDPGTPDGFIGPRTEAAIKAFQNDQGLVASGEVDADTLQAIQRVQFPPEPIALIPAVETKPQNSSSLLGWIAAGILSVIILILLGRSTIRKAADDKSEANKQRDRVRVAPSKLEPSVGPARSKKDQVSRQNGTTRSAWVPQTESVSVAGREIGGMIYVGPAPGVDRYGERCRAYIDPSLSVTKQGGDYDGDGMSYWPGYATITAKARATYLDWLANGRSDSEYNAGYMFLYFYGLERRMFLDAPSKNERALIISEVRRLRELYKDNYSARNYLSRFIDAAELFDVPSIEIEPVYENHEYELPLALRLAVGKKIRKGEKLDAKWILSWFVCHPERRLRTPATRCWEEFSALFKHEFSKNYPDGLSIKPPKRVLKDTYRAASGEFERELKLLADGMSVPDISNLRQPVSIAQKIADEAMASLDKYSRYLGRNPDGRGSVEAHALLPFELWSSFPSTELDELRHWGNEVISSGGAIPTTELIARMESKVPEKIGKRHLTSAADALARLGIGMAPDPRCAIRKPAQSEPVILFRLQEPVMKLEDASETYQKTLTRLAMATFVAQADNEVVAAERKALQDIIADAAPNLNEGEAERLIANQKWLLEVPPNFSLLKRRVSAADTETKETLKRIALVMASADNVIQPEEVRSIEKIYSALGLETASLYSDLHATSTSDELVPVRPAQEAVQGEPIAEELESSSPSVGLKLNKDLIRTKQAQTAEVSQLLQGIFSDSESDEDGEELEPVKEDIFAKLDSKHKTFLRVLIERSRWSEQDYDDLANRFQLLPSGALETINEWAFDTFEDELIETYDGYEMNVELADIIETKIAEGGL